jgi:hypothetical protein
LVIFNGNGAYIIYVEVKDYASVDEMGIIIHGGDLNSFK